MNDRHQHDDSRDSSTFLAVIIALAILLFGGGALLTVRYQRAKAMQAREMELRAIEAAVLAKQQQMNLMKENSQVGK